MKNIDFKFNCKIKIFAFLIFFYSVITSTPFVEKCINLFFAWLRKFFLILKMGPGSIKSRLVGVVAVQLM